MTPKSEEVNRRRKFRPTGFILVVISIILLIWGSWQVWMWLKDAGGV